jgi:hypothetical protein
MSQIKFLDDVANRRLADVIAALDAGVDVNTASEDGKTALLVATEKYYIDLVAIRIS